jgi:hypothetical protein
MTTPFHTLKSPIMAPMAHLSIPSTMTLIQLDTSAEPSQKRCNHGECKRKLLLSDFACKCGIRFCGTHRIPEGHACRFNFRAAADAKLSQQLGKAFDTRMTDKI